MNPSPRLPSHLAEIFIIFIAAKCESSNGARLIAERYAQLLQSSYLVIMTREKAIKTLKEMPAEFNLEELIDRLILIEKVEAGVKQADDGKTTPHEKVREITQKW